MVSSDNQENILQRIIRFFLKLFGLYSPPKEEVSFRRKEKEESDGETFYDLYSAKKKPVTLDKRTLIERSWDFLELIGEKVTQIFSRADQKKLLDLGVKLAAEGMVYRHDPKLSGASLAAAENTPGMKQKTQEQSTH